MANTPGEILDQLDPLYEAMMEEQRKMKALEDDLIPIVKKLVVINYPEVFHLESKGYKSLDDTIWIHVDRLVRDVNEITCRLAEKN